MFCPNCGKEQLYNPRFCPSCGTNLVQESVIQPDIKPEIEPSAGPGVNHGIQPKSRSAALKWGTGILFVLAVVYLINMIGLILLIQMGFEVPFLLGDFIAFFVALPAAIFAAMRKHWRYIRGVTIWLPVSTILGIIFLFVGGEIGTLLPEDIAFGLSVFLAEITCLILFSRTKTEFP
jgi:cation transport ATPase